VQRRPNPNAALTDFICAGAAFVGGWVGAPVPFLLVLGIAAVIAWWWTRRQALAAMAPKRRTTQSAIAIAMIAGALALFYWIGLMLGGHT